jgi:hypothetical protein
MGLRHFKPQTKIMDTVAIELHSAAEADLDAAREK